MNYRSFSDLNEDIVKWIPTLPRNIELVVGIPRSGLLAANLLSLHLNIPMTDLDGFLEGRILSAGGRLRDLDSKTFLTSPRFVLVVDDSICSGHQMLKIKNILSQRGSIHKIEYAAVYAATYEGMNSLDHYYMHLSLPRIFEWNLFHHSLLESSCVDIDGVLCRDPSEEENDDGLKYEDFLKNVLPIHVPSAPIGWLVTCRLEKYRSITEEWLKRQNIHYKNLLMMPYSSKADRQNAHNYAGFKSKAYKESDSVLFIESSLTQAVDIAKESGKFVYCIENRALVEPQFFAKVKGQIGIELKKTLRYPKARLRSMIAALLWFVKRKK